MSKKGNGGGCLLGLFSIGVMVFFLFFLGATIFFFVGPQAIFGTDCTQGSKTTLINDLYATSVEGYKLLCTADCPCNIKDTNSELFNRVNPKGKISSTGVEKFGDCSGIQSSTANIEILAALENLLSCGGWCPPSQDNPPFGYTYRFRNINDCSTLCNFHPIQNA